MRCDVLGAIERRRRWTDAEKFAVLCEEGRHDASATLVAQRHDLRRHQIFAWRHDLRKKGLCEPEGAALFLPVEVATQSAPEAKMAANIAVPMVEIVPRNSRQIQCLGVIGEDDLARLIRLVEAA